MLHQHQKIDLHRVVFTVENLTIATINDIIIIIAKISVIHPFA